MFCNVDDNAVVQSMDMPTIYEVPLRMQEQKLDVTILEKMGLPVGETPTLGPWKAFLERRHKATEKVKIGLVGKYDLQDAYKSILEALSQAATYNDRKADIHFINSEKLTEENIEESLKDMDGIIICPGIRPTRYRRQVYSYQILPYTQCTDFRYLSGYAVYGNRVCT